MTSRTAALVLLPLVTATAASGCRPADVVPAPPTAAGNVVGRVTAAPGDVVVTVRRDDGSRFERGLRHPARCALGSYYPTCDAG